MAGSFEYLEILLQRRRRLAMARLQLVGSIGVGFSLLWWLGGDYTFAMLVVTGVSWIVLPPLGIFMCQLRRIGPAALRSNNGPGLAIEQQERHGVRRERRHGSERPFHPGTARNHAFVNINADGLWAGTLRLPLQLLRPDIFDDFTNALRRYWPEIDECRQTQLRNRGLDSSAG
ncbi:MAG: hypothetical protein GJ676_07520 [Rhodobacteraceae bacterium]|nr:hypothetical protein [Paracoccaceae bacterium]